MAISLIGIISIQVVWISDAVEQQSLNFKSHVNDALNEVNASIGEDEAVFFIEEQFGGLDSLIREVRFVGPNAATEDHIIISENPGSDQRVEIKFDYTNSEVGEDHEKTRTVKSSSWMKKVEVVSDDNDSVIIESNGIDTAKMKNISSIVEHFSFEKSLSGDLIDRISPDTLRRKLHKAFNKEGIDNAFAFAVMNTKKQQLEQQFTSKSFNAKDSEHEYAKTLFPNDRINDGKYVLKVQFDQEGSYVWKSVRLMAFSSAIFTILILLSFGYALYFIYKQKKISRVKSDFINNMTHELKTPLATISLATSSIKHPNVINNPTEITRFTTIIDQEKQRMNAHIERVLEIAALDKGEITLNKTTFDAVEMIQQAITNATLALNEIGGAIHFQTKENIELTGDQYHLLNVLNNVIDNGIKYRSKALPKLDIALKETNSEVIIAVTDNGLGMDSTTKKLAFDTFYRAERGNIHATKGFGLGLSYVKNIVEAHGGTVELESKLGQGTTVIITLPKG